MKNTNFKKYLLYTFVGIVTIKNFISKIREIVYFFFNIESMTCSFCKGICQNYTCNKCIKYLKSFKIHEVKYLDYSKILGSKRKNILKSMSMSNYSKVKKIVLDAKFFNKPYIFGSIIYFLKKDILKKFEYLNITSNNSCIFFVGMHRKKENIRGYNQSEIISKYLKQITKIPVINIIYENDGFKKQSLLKKEEREKNVSGRYYISQEKIVLNKEKLKNIKNIILVDDIITTGNTILEVDRIILENYYLNYYLQEANILNFAISSH